MELRKDYILDRWVILAAKRASRPKQFSHAKKRAIDYFAPGNEHLTPPEIGRIGDAKSWKMRWFANKFPIVEAKGKPHIETHNEFYSFSDAYGHHEVIVETPDNKQLWDLPANDLAQLFKVYKERINDLSKLPHIEYVTIFKNHGKEAGTSLVHSHTQVAGLNFIPKNLAKKCEASKNDDVYQRIIDREKDSERRCFENDKFIAFTPYASRFNYEIIVFPKVHLKTMENFQEDDFTSLSEIMKHILDKLKQLDAAYNYCVYYSPPGENMRFHIEVLPRLATWAGFEFSTDTLVNSVSPEDAARYYRGEND